MSIKKDVLDKVVDKTNEHSNTWKGRPISTWLLGLHEEVSELDCVIHGDHDDSLENELVQIASIALNWLDHGAKR